MLKEGVASITTNGEFKSDTERLHKMREISGLWADRCFEALHAPFKKTAQI